MANQVTWDSLNKQMHQLMFEGVQNVRFIYSNVNTHYRMEYGIPAQFMDFTREGLFVNTLFGKLQFMVDRTIPDDVVYLTERPLGLGRQR